MAQLAALIAAQAASGYRIMIDRMYDTAPADEQHIQRWLSTNCFGDH